MFKDKIEQLLQRNKNNTKALNDIEMIFDKLNNYVHTLETGRMPNDKSYKDCLSCMKHLNILCETAETPRIFPRLDELNKAEITKAYIIGIANEYVKLRKK